MDLRPYLIQQYLTSHVVIDQQILPTLSPEQMRARPDGGGNSAAWILWHATRCEDVAINAMVRGTPQVMTLPEFAGAAGLGDARIGTGLGDDEVAAFSDTVDVDALVRYRKAVRKEVLGWLADCDLALLDEKPDLDARLASLGALWSEKDAWVRDIWGGFTNATFVSWLGSGHTLVHAGEMQATLARIGVVGR